MAKILTIAFGLVCGLLLGYIVFLDAGAPLKEEIIDVLPHKKQVIGFLPYWLLDRVEGKDYSRHITTLTYFGLTVASDGAILKLTTPTEEEPGWTTLKSNRLKKILESAKEKDITLSLLIFSADEEAIDSLVSHPKKHANTLMDQVIPIMGEYGFTDLNLDIESVKPASQEARMHFIEFTHEVKKRLDEANMGTLSIDISPTAFIKPYLIDPMGIKESVDNVIIMAYDYHYQGSAVTGPVAPLYGADTESEFDTDAGIRQVLAIYPARKVLLGIPLYGYAWETIDPVPRAAVLPGSGLTSSNLRTERFLADCASCSAKVDKIALESYVIYRNSESGIYHQIFFPDKNATQAKVDYAQKYKLGGVAMWALGYEGETILDPIANYR